jgi:hypothetical protein
MATGGPTCTLSSSPTTPRSSSCTTPGWFSRPSASPAAADADQPTDWADQYMRLAVRFETGAQQYLWLNTNLFIAKGRLLGTGHIEYEVYRVL